MFEVFFFFYMKLLQLCCSLLIIVSSMLSQQVYEYLTYILSRKTKTRAQGHSLFNVMCSLHALNVSRNK